MRVLTDLYIHDTRDNIVDYKLVIDLMNFQQRQWKICYFLREYAGEQDHSSYDLRVLQKPVYHLPDDSTTANNDQIGKSYIFR